MESLQLDRAIITDHNTEGFDSVDSNDFDPGFGCVVAEAFVLPTPPPVIQPVYSEKEQEALWWQSVSESERDRMNDEYLGRKGIF